MNLKGKLKLLGELFVKEKKQDKNYEDLSLRILRLKNSKSL